MSTTGLSVSIDQLRIALGYVLDECERKLGGAVHLEADHYWIVGPSEAFDLTKEPTPTVGQLSDDIESIEEARTDDDPAWHLLSHLIGPLMRLASLSMSEEPPTA